MSDIDQIRRDVSLPATVQAFGVALVENGNEYEGCCPFHEERTPSFTLFAGKDRVWRFQCFGCGASGDVIDFVENIQGVTKAEAIKILNGDRDKGRNIAPAQIEARDPYQGITPLDPPHELVPDRKITLYNPKREQNGNITPSMVFPYRRRDGSLVGYVLRHDLPDGKKETPQVQWVRLPDGRECWCRLPFAKPRPLYGIDRIGAETKQIFIVEGEKCVEVFNQITGRVAVSWPGGTNGVRHCDWSALRGMDIVIWPDFDKPGFSAARDVTAALNGIARRVRFIDFGLGVRRERDDF